MRELLHRPRTAAVARFLTAENIVAAMAEPGVGGPWRRRLSGGSVLPVTPR